MLLLLNSTPIISSPWIVDFPIFVLKKSKALVKALFFFIVGDFGSLIPSKDGFFNLIFLSLPNKFENFSFVVEVVLLFSCLIFSLVIFDVSSIFFSTLWLTIGSAVCKVSVVFWATTSWVSLPVETWVSFCFVVSLWTSLLDVVWFSWLCLFNLSLSAWISSNHFSKIGMASSKFWVPDEDIFCFPSIYSLPTQFFDFSSPLYLSCLTYICSLPSFLWITWCSCLLSDCSGEILVVSVDVSAELSWFDWLLSEEGWISEVWVSEVWFISLVVSFWSTSDWLSVSTLLSSDLFISSLLSSFIFYPSEKFFFPNL